MELFPKEIYHRELSCNYYQKEISCNYYQDKQHKWTLSLTWVFYHNVSKYFNLDNCIYLQNGSYPFRGPQQFLIFLFFAHLVTSGPGCSKLTKLISQICQYFLLEKCEKLLHCKSFSHFFNKKYQCTVFGYEVLKDLMSWPLNEIVKLTMLWTTGPWRLSWMVHLCTPSRNHFHIHFQHVKQLRTFHIFAIYSNSG